MNQLMRYPALVFVLSLRALCFGLIGASLRKRHSFREDEREDFGAVRTQLRKYLDLRVLFYQTRHEQELRRITADTSTLQAEMWSALQAPAGERPTPVSALALSGINDVLNSQGYTQAAGGTASQLLHGIY